MGPRHVREAELICISDFDPKGMGGYAEALHDRRGPRFGLRQRGLRLFRSASGQKVSLKAQDRRACAKYRG